MKHFITATLLALTLANPVFADGETKKPETVQKLPSQSDVNCPIKLEITGTVVLKKSKLRNSAIVNDTIWWEGDTKKLRLDDGGWVELKLVKVVHGKTIFELRGRVGRPPQFEVKLKQSSNWGLTRSQNK